MKRTLSLIMAIVCMAFNLGAYLNASDLSTVNIKIDAQIDGGPINRDIAGIMTDPPRPDWLCEHLATLGLVGDIDAVKKHQGGANYFWLPELDPTFVNLGWGGDTVILFDIWPAEGEYNFDALDGWIESHKARGSDNLSIVLSAVPEWLWTDSPANKEPSGAAINFFPYLKKGHVLPPRDYDKYEEAIYQTVKHLNVDKGYGIKFSTFNEPNVRFFQGTQEEWLKTCAAITRGVKRADPTSKVGGPATAQLSPVWIKAYLKYYAENDLPVDFISWHYYYYYAMQSGHVMSFTDQCKLVRNLASKHPELGDPKIYITEWAYDWKSSDLVGPTFNGAFVAQSLYEMHEAGVAGATYCGGLGTLDHPDPAAQAFKMFNQLEKHRSKVEVDCNESGIQAIATGRQGRIAILVWNLPGDSGVADGAAQPVSINLHNIGATTYRMKRQLVDKDNFQSVDPAMIENRAITSDGTLALDFTLLPYSFSLIELTPEI